MLFAVASLLKKWPPERHGRGAQAPEGTKRALEGVLFGKMQPRLQKSIDRKPQRFFVCSQRLREQNGLASNSTQLSINGGLLDLQQQRLLLQLRECQKMFVVFHLQLLASTHLRLRRLNFYLFPRLWPLGSRSPRGGSISNSSTSDGRLFQRSHIHENGRLGQKWHI